jgi:hypothetical protein
MTMAMPTLAVLLATLSTAAPGGDFAGLWQIGQGEVFELKRQGADVWAFGRGPTRRIFHGRVEAEILRGSWTEATATAWAAGALSLQLVTTDRMSVVEVGGGFPQDDWHRLSIPVGAVALEWGQNASTVAADADCFLAWCPPGGLAGAVWGSEVYTADSSVCTAALHAGIIAAATGGPFTVRMLPGQQSYRGTARNGVSSQDWASYPASFTFGEKCDPARPRPGSSAALPINATAATAATTSPRGAKTVWFSCAEGLAFSTVWGTDVYTDDSPVCGAAVHAGVLRAGQGGVVAIELVEGRQSYSGTARNGITSQSWGSWPRAFKVKAR